jgi:hypothetical protein
MRCDVHRLSREVQTALTHRDADLPFAPNRVKIPDGPGKVTLNPAITDCLGDCQSASQGVQPGVDFAQAAMVAAHEPVGHPQPVLFAGGLQQGDRPPAVLETLKPSGRSIVSDLLGSLPRPCPLRS